MEGKEGGVNIQEECVYRISTPKEWEALQKHGETFGGDLDKASGFVHLSSLNQVKGTLKNFFKETEDLFLLQIETKKLGGELVYEAVDSSNYFPHFYGPSRSHSPLKLGAVIKAEKLEFVGGEFSCSLLSGF